MAAGNGGSGFVLIFGVRCDMLKMPAVIAAFAAALLTASAAADDVDMQFVRALQERDRARRGEALLKLAERNGYPAELALIHLTRAQLPPHSVARILPIARFRLGELVPTVLLARAFRMEEASAPGTLARSELFHIAHTAWKNAAARELSPFEHGLFRELSGEVLKLSWECGETAQIFPDISRRITAGGQKWIRDFPVSALLEFFYRHAFVNEGFELYSKEWRDSQSPGRRAFAAVLRMQSALKPESDAEADARLRFLLAIEEYDAAALLAAVRLDEKQDKDRVGWVILSVVKSGNAKAFKTIRPMLKASVVPFLKGELLAGGGKFREALELLPQISDPANRARLEFVCRNGLGEFAAAAAIAGDPKSPLDKRTRILALLALAETDRNAAWYAAAERLAGNEIDTDAAYANSFGYVALVLGMDRDLAEKRIRRALELQPDNSSYLDSLALARHLAGDHAGAWKLMERALRSCDPQPESCEILEHAAAIRLALGDRDGARRCCEMALKLALAGESSPRTAVYFRPRVANIRKMLEQIK